MRTPLHRTCQRLLLAICCSSATACPPTGERDAGPGSPSAIDGGPDDGGPVDGGPSDGGGEGEGEGEGEVGCHGRGEVSGQPDDAGVIHYEECGLAEFLFGSCNDGSCATSDAEHQFVDLLLEVASARGYGDRIEVVEVHDDLPEEVIGRVALVADWVRAYAFVQAEVDDAGQVVREGVESSLPYVVPATLPAVEEVLARLRTCAPVLVVSFCDIQLCGSPSCVANAVVTGDLGGMGTATCIAAETQLWDPLTPDAGPPEVSCLVWDLPCCE